MGGYKKKQSNNNKNAVWHTMWHPSSPPWSGFLVFNVMLCVLCYLVLLIFCKIFYRIFYEIFYKIFYNGLPKAPQIAAKSVKVWF